MTEQHVRVGVIGAGTFAEECHIPGVQAHAQGEVVALCAGLYNIQHAVNLPIMWFFPRDACMVYPLYFAREKWHSTRKSEPACLNVCDFDHQTDKEKTHVVRCKNVLLPVDNMTEDVRNE